MSSRLIALTTIVALLLIVGCKNSDAESRANAAAHASLSSATSAASAVGAPVEFFEVTGIAAAVRTSSLSPKVGGILRSIKVRAGDRVKAGQVLAVLDTVDTNLRVQAAQVGQLQAIEGVKNAKSDLDRVAVLFDAGAVADQPMEKAQLALRVAELQLDQAKVAQKMAEQAMVDATVHAPFSGVITKVQAEEGQMITTMPPVVIFVIADIDTLEVRVPIPERRIAQVKNGMEVEVILPAVNVTRKATIARLGDVVDSMTRSNEAIIRLENKDHSLPGGLHARVRFPSIVSEDQGTAGTVVAPTAASSSAENRR